MIFLGENEREGGLRPNIWVAYNRFLPTAPVIFLKTDQVVVIKVASLKGDLFFCY